jgi:hypothetical protein
VADLRFLVEFTVSIAVLASPIVLIARLLAADGDVTVGDLYIPRSDDLLGPGAIDEDPPPRWRPELIGAHHHAAEPVTSGSRVSRANRSWDHERETDGPSGAVVRAGSATRHGLGLELEDDPDVNRRVLAVLLYLDGAGE